MKIKSITSHAVERFKQRFKDFSGTKKTDKEIKKIIKNSIENCPDYFNLESYFINKFEKSKKIPLPIRDINGAELGVLNVVLKNNRSDSENYSVITVY